METIESLKSDKAALRSAVKHLLWACELLGYGQENTPPEAKEWYELGKEALDATKEK